MSDVEQVKKLPSPGDPEIFINMGFFYNHNRQCLEYWESGKKAASWSLVSIYQHGLKVISRDFKIEHLVNDQKPKGI